MRLRRPRFEELSAEWLAELEGENKSAHTIKAYSADLRLWNQSGLDPHSYLLSLQAAGAAPATQNRRRAVLRAYHGWLQGKGLIDVNPLERVRPTKNPSRLRATLSVDEVVRLVDAAGQLGMDREERDTEGFGHWPVRMYQLRLQAMISLQVTAGLRVSELLRVRHCDLDIDGRRVRITRKGGDEQQVRFGMAAKRRIERWIEQLLFIAELEPITPEAWLFIGDRGNPVTRKTYAGQLVRACWIAGIDPISPHALRHTFATHAVESGMPVADLQQMLGHKQVTTTMGYVQRHPDRGFDRYDELHPLAGETLPSVGHADGHADPTH